MTKNWRIILDRIFDYSKNVFDFLESSSVSRKLTRFLSISRQISIEQHPIIWKFILMPYSISLTDLLTYAITIVGGVVPLFFCRFFFMLTKTIFFLHKEKKIDCTLHTVLLTGRTLHWLIGSLARHSGRQTWQTETVMTVTLQTETLIMR
jgi:hypothetical protein